MFRQRLACRFGARGRSGGRPFLFAGAVLGDQVFQPGFELLNFTVDLLGLAAEVQVLELGDL